MHDNCDFEFIHRFDINVISRCLRLKSFSFRWKAWQFVLVGKKMVVSCCAYGSCTNRFGEKKGLGFFRFPLKPMERRSRWIQAVRRKNWNPSPHSRICGEHFVSGHLHNTLYIHVFSSAC